MPTVNLLARNCTLFTTTKALDEDAYRQSLQRYSIKPRLIADLCDRYPQVESVTLRTRSMIQTVNG